MSAMIRFYCLIVSLLSLYYGFSSTTTSSNSGFSDLLSGGVKDFLLKVVKSLCSIGRLMCEPSSILVFSDLGNTFIGPLSLKERNFDCLELF